MEIRLKQLDVEAAVKAHLTRMGFDRPVTQMTFTAGRGGKGLTVEIEVSDPFTDAEESAKEATDPTPETPPASKPAPAPAKANKPGPKAKAKPTAVPAASGDDDIQPDTDETEDDGAPPIDDEPPFATSQAANEAPTTPKGKSLFG